MGLKPQLLPDSLLRCIPGSERAVAGLGQTAAESTEQEAAKSEKLLQRALLQYLRLNEIPANASRMDKRKTDAIGWPDIAFVIGGRALFFECKSATGRVEADQERCHAALRAAGAQVWIVRSLVDGINIIRQLREESK